MGLPMLSLSTSSHRLQPQQPSSHPLNSFSKQPERKTPLTKKLTCSLLLPHLLSNFLLLTLHLRAGHVVGFLLYSENGVSKVFLGNDRIFH
jgi:hypothetical protein